MNGLFGSSSWLYIALAGFLAGLIARALKPGDNRLGLILTTLLGIGGALLAGGFGRYMGWYAADLLLSSPGEVKHIRFLPELIVRGSSDHRR